MNDSLLELISNVYFSSTNNDCNEKNIHHSNSDIFSCCTKKIYALTTKVNTLTALKTAFTAALPGDSIILLNGTYNWGGIVLTNNNNTSTGAWIVLKAESLSGVIFTGNTYLQFSGTRILVDGFEFASGNSGTNAVMAFRSSSSVLANYSRISNITFDNYSLVDKLKMNGLPFTELTIWLYILTDKISISILFLY